MRGLGVNGRIGGALVLGVVLTALLSYVWTPHDPEAIVIGDRFIGFMQQGHLLGTDHFGRDILSRLMVGSRQTLFVGILAVGISLVIGIPLGALAASFEGWISDILMRISDIMFAFPAILMALLIAAARGPSTSSAMMAIGLAFSPIVARVTRAASLTVLDRDFITAARSYGRGRLYIFFRHVLPNISSVLIVQATVLFSLAILAEAALSYLGLGTQPPTPSWGRALLDAQTQFGPHPSLALWPGLAIAASVIGFNLLGDGMRDFLDPKLAKTTSSEAGPA